MHPYLSHLLKDIAAAHRSKPPELLELMHPKNFEEEMERWMEGEKPTHSFSYYCGLKVEEFPPPELLTNDEMILICKAFRQMMLSWNLDADLPHGMPTNRFYSFLISTLNLKTDIVTTGFFTFEFCQYYPPGCILKEFCWCLEDWNTNNEDPDCNSLQNDFAF